MELVAQAIILEEQRKNRLGEIVREESPKLLNFIRRQLPQYEEPEDVLQDVLSDLTEAFYLPQTIAQTSAWMYRVTKNRIADVFRKKRPVRFSDTDDGESRWLENLILAEEDANDMLWNETIMNAINKAVQKLPNDQRDVFVRHEINGESFKAISLELKIGIPTLTSRKRYAIEKLQGELAELYQELISD